MKTTMEISDPLLRKRVRLAAREGVTLRHWSNADFIMS